MKRQHPRIVADSSEPASGSSLPTLLHEEITRGVIGAFYAVYNELRYGFLESVYRDAMLVELRHRGLEGEAEGPLLVWYKGQPVGHFRADVLVERCVVLELKACSAVGAPERQQLLNYLRGTGLEVGLLLHFGPRPAIARMVMSDELHGPTSAPRRSAASRLGDDLRPRFSPRRRSEP